MRCRRRRPRASAPRCTRGCMAEALPSEAPASSEAQPPAHFPRELSASWPSAWRANPGSRTGALARVECALVNAGLGGAARLPDGARALLLDALAFVAHKVDRRHTRAAREWIDQAFGPGLAEDELARRVRRAFRHLFRVTVDTHRATRVIEPARLREHVEVVKTADVERVLAERRGALIASAHFGDWETMGAVLPWLGFDPLYAVSRPIRNRYLSLHAQAARERRGVRIVPRAGAMQEIPRILASGGHVVMLLDQRGRHRPVLAPFFGREAACERAPSVLARRSRCPILFATCAYGDAPLSWRLELGPVLWPEQTRRMDPVELATRINAELERRIRARPEQQLWVHDRYRARAPQPRELENEATDSVEAD
ncbi:MAG: hypothetical protein EPO68_07565 [Planctomycetota bacterium]|nr:MAG: hypothetical protein EPO68_07565 [Planctomycetota bacterium]